MNASNPQTIEEVLLKRMGVSVESAIATGTDIIDEKVASAVDSGTDIDARINGLGQILEKLSNPTVLAALGQLLGCLPQLVSLAKIADELPNAFAIVTDVLDDYQKGGERKGVDIEKAVFNGLQAALFLGSQIESEHLQRIGELLGSEILNPHALGVVNNAAKSLASAQESTCGEKPDRIGIFGMLAALRDPQIQRSLAFAVQFGKCFGKNFDADQS